MKRLIAAIQKPLQGIYATGEATALTRLLVVKLLGFNDIDYFTKPAVTLTPAQQALLDEALARLMQHEPVQYVLGDTDFCGLTFKVNPSVLIPRPETAELVEWIFQDLSERDASYAPRILDMGCGSGCIAITLSHRLPAAQVKGWDISPTALLTAETNNRLNHTRVTFEKEDVLHISANSLLPHSFDLIVSNPPYITDSEKSNMEPQVTQWEPSTALYVPNDDPLLFYRAIARASLTLLPAGGSLYFEINRAYGAQVCELLSTFGFQNIHLRRDSYGNDRMIKATKP